MDVFSCRTDEARSDNAPNSRWVIRLELLKRRYNFNTFGLFANTHIHTARLKIQMICSISPGSLPSVIQLSTKNTKIHPYLTRVLMPGWSFVVHNRDIEFDAVHDEYPGLEFYSLCRAVFRLASAWQIWLARSGNIFYVLLLSDVRSWLCYVTNFQGTYSRGYPASSPIRRPESSTPHGIWWSAGNQK